MEGSVAGRKDRITSHGKSYPLQYLRGIAALIVLLYHASFYTNTWRKDPRFLDIFGQQLGQLGVLLFFVISGSMMAVVAAENSPAQFMMRRVLRIYPTYLLVALSLLALASTLQTGVTFDAWALGLVPGQHTYGLGVEWTLPYELTFYILVFGMMLAGLGRFAAWIGIAWCLAIVALHLLGSGPIGSQQFPTIVTIPLASASAGFALGMATPRLSRLPFLIAFGIPVALFALVVGHVDTANRLWWFIAASTLLVAAAISPSASRVKPVRALANFGDWSFAIYLIHVQIVIAVLRFTPSDWSGAAEWTIAVIAAVCAGVAVGIIDVRLHRTLRTFAEKSSTTFKTSAAAAFVTVYLIAGFAWMAMT